MVCSRCGEQFQLGANFCPRCAMPANQQSFRNFTAQANPTTANSIPTKRVGILLGIGILFMPYIFSWFTLQKGYSSLARIVSLSWMGLIFLLYIPTIILNSRNTEPRNAATLTATTNTSTTVSSTPSESPKQAALRQATINFKWSKGGFGSVMEADFTIQNPSNYAIKDIEVTCTHFANSGTEIDSNTRTIYETVPAKGKKVVKNFNMGFIHSQAHKSGCEIEDLVIVQ